MPPCGCAVTLQMHDDNSGVPSSPRDCHAKKAASWLSAVRRAFPRDVRTVHAQDGYRSPWTESPHQRTHAGVVHDKALSILGQRIRVRRKALGWTQEDLAEHSNIDRSYIGGVERGERNITFGVLCRICAALACDVAALTNDLPGAEK